MSLVHRNKKCKEVATQEFLKGRLVLLVEMERPLSISHVFSKQSVFYFFKLAALCFSPLMLYFIFNPSLPFLPVFAGEISLCHVFLFWLFFGRCMVSSVAPSLLFIFVDGVARYCWKNLIFICKFSIFVPQFGYSVELLHVWEGKWVNK